MYALIDDIVAQNVPAGHKIPTNDYFGKSANIHAPALDECKP